MKKEILCLCLLMLSMFGLKAEQIKLYTFYTPSHEILLKDWFLPSIKDDYEIIIRAYDQECPSGRFYQQGWTLTTIHKIEMMIDAVGENWGKVFIYSDVDIQFFRKSEETILKYIQGKDLVIQRDSPKGVLCTGFFACRANERTLQFWENVRDTMINNQKMSDQAALNCTIRAKKNQIIWDYLPNEFLGGGTLTGEIWSPEHILTVPENIILHHANYTRGVENKIAQLIHVREIVESRSRIVD